MEVKAKTFGPRPHKPMKRLDENVTKLNQYVDILNNK